MSQSWAVDGDHEAPLTGEADPTWARSTAFWLRLLAGLVALFAVLTLWAVSVPGTYFLLFMILPTVWIVLGIGWVLQAIRLAYRRGLGSAARSGWLLGSAAVALITAVAVMADVPLQLRFEASRGSLEDLAALMTGADSPEGIPDMPVGLFDAEGIERVTGGFRFLVKGTGFLDPVGFAYSPGGPPPVTGEDRYDRFSGPWWVWTASW